MSNRYTDHHETLYTSIHATALRKSYNNFYLLNSIVTLHIGDQTLPAHKLLLETASEVFRAAFTGHWNNAATNQYTIEGHSTDVAIAMIKHIYGFELQGIKHHTEDQNIRFLLDVYIIGEEYLIDSLQVAVILKIRELLERLYGLQDNGPLKRLIEAIITLYDTNKLRDCRTPGYWPVRRTLLETTARFCTKYGPACVEDMCLPPTDAEQSRERYRKFVTELCEAQDDDHEDCRAMGQGCELCEPGFHRSKLDCDCERTFGEWSQEFMDWVEDRGGWEREDEDEFDDQTDLVDGQSQ